jgi:hypothetical protein
VLNRLSSFWKHPADGSTGIAFRSTVMFFLMSSASWNLFIWRRLWPWEREKCYQENWDCLDKLGWSLGMMWFSVASAPPWVWVGRTLLRSTSSINLHVGFDESFPYWCLIHLTSVWEPVDDLASSFHGHLQLCLHFERLKDVCFLNYPEGPHARLYIA